MKLNNKDRMKLKEIQEKIGGNEILKEIVLMDYADSPELAKSIANELKELLK